MTYTVIQYGTGITGMKSLRGVLKHPDLELVGLVVHSPEKVGCTAGEIAGVAGPGRGRDVRGNGDLNALVTQKADCVLYMPSDPKLSNPADPGSHGEALFERLCAILESGKNVVSTALVQMHYPPAMAPRLAKRLQEACHKGKSTFFCTGVSTGFLYDVLPLNFTGLCHSIRSIRVAQILDLQHTPEPQMLAAYGFGSKPGADGLKDQHGAGARRYVDAWSSSLHMIADTLKLRIEDIQFGTAVDTTPFDIDIGNGVIAKGTLAAHRFEIVGLVNKKPAISLERIVRMHPDVAPQWFRLPEGRRWGARLEIDGDPMIQNEFYLRMPERETGSEASYLATAQRAVNAVPAVCRAAPGPSTFMDVPAIVGVHAFG